MVGLYPENIPPHMHHSSITTGAKMQNAKAKPGSTTFAVKGGTVYDIFYNDSIPTGLRKNELDGCFDEFTPQSAG